MSLTAHQKFLVKHMKDGDMVSWKNHARLDGISKGVFWHMAKGGHCVIRQPGLNDCVKVGPRLLLTASRFCEEDPKPEPVQEGGVTTYHSSGRWVPIELLKHSSVNPQ